MIAGARSFAVVAVLAVAAWLGVVRKTTPRAAVEKVSSEPIFGVSIGEPLPFIDPALRARFERGRAVAMRRFAPETGLGPEYNAVSCRNCHEKPVVGGSASRYRGVTIAATMKPSFVVPFEKHYTVRGITKPHASNATTHLPSPFFGIGLLAEIPAQEIARRADPNDANHDGVSGRVNFERGFVGRFGRKAQMSSLQGFIRLALLDHMGITSTPVAMPFPLEREAPVEMPTRDADEVPDGELPAEDLRDLIAFVALLAPPRPDAPTTETERGRELFASVGCTSCHVSELRGPRGPVPAYTDLLLHDMGSDLADGVRVGEASAAEFRTTPLWGIAAGGPYMHDGRASTIDEAILAHGGEAESASKKYVALSASDRALVVSFLKSLGGRDRESDGLLAKDEPVPQPGVAGGPDAHLDEASARRFARGRALFDHDFSPREGLGGAFNGDACRSCHFDPVIGGAGPADVDVVRHGRVDGAGAFFLPSSGDTMAHRFLTVGARPIVDPGANLLERRQTPSILGLGLIDAIDERAILARQDPDDRDGDGVRGVASILEDGRVGRFGWRAQMPTLRDFVVDAFAGELGIDVKTELAKSDLDDLVFFVQRLARPVPAKNESDELAHGRGTFGALGCRTCHVPALPANDGRSIALYSDLLLHDVAPKGTAFVPQASKARGFRTPPLWGISMTAPYLHDGSATTLDAAIRAHDGEASHSRARYVAAGDRERAALLAFLGAL